MVAAIALIAALTVKCAPDNDLWRVLTASGIQARRFDTAAEAIHRAPRGSGVLILADGYPDRTETVAPDLFDRAAAKKLRLYIEYPSSLPGHTVGQPRGARFERAVVVSRLRILGLHDCHYVPIAAANPEIVIARVAGFDRAVYGLPEHDVFPILFNDRRLMVAATKLSQFVTARYAPAEAWRQIWVRILGWAMGTEPPDLRWTPEVRPAYTAADRLPDSTEAAAAQRNIDWYLRSRLLIDPTWERRVDEAASFPDRVGPAPGLDLPAGDGTLGLLEGFSSRIGADGAQQVRWWLRADCIGESSFPLALNPGTRPVARNLNDFLYFKSGLQRDDAFGLLAWSVGNPGVFYGDDNARALLGTIGAAAVLKESRWDEAVSRGILGNYKTTGRYGFRGNRFHYPKLDARDVVNYAPHYEAYLWAVNLWAYRQTGYRPFLDRTGNAIRMTMAAYPNEWHWTNGIQQERARMLLPLAWLVRVADTPQHREWLARIADDILSAQDASGAIREEIGSAGKGAYNPPRSNEEYGTTESPLIQQNGDPLADLLYTTNFAFFGLHEAAAATGSARYRQAEDRLAAFLCRIQIRSEKHHELDGAWFRAFDFRNWDYWGSDADAGWGAWSIETGWTQAWINSVLQLRTLNTSYWDLTRDSGIGRHLDAIR